MTVIGHEHVLKRLERELPQVTLIQGPASVGKHVLALHLLTAHSGMLIDIPLLTADVARSVVAEAGFAPFGSRKNFLIDLDGASEQAQNILLKTLEEPPVTVRFILLASRPPLETVRSRCTRCPAGLLTDEQVAQVLVSLGIRAEDAGQYAPWGQGQVAPALEAAQATEESRKARSAVSTALRAALSHDGPLLAAIMRTWEPPHTVQLGLWAVEKAAGRWRRFDEATAPGASKAQARSLLVVLSSYAEARTAAAVALAEAFAPSL